MEESTQPARRSSVLAKFSPPEGGIPADLVYETSHDSMWVVRFTPPEIFRCVSVNPAFVALSGIPYDQLIGRELRDIVANKDLPRTLEFHLQATRARSTLRYETPIEIQRQILTAEVSLTPVRDEHNVCTYLLGVARDVTEHKRVVEELRAREDFAFSILDSFSSHVVVIDQKSHILSVNDCWMAFVKKYGTDGALNPLGKSYFAVAQSSGEYASIERAAHIDLNVTLKTLKDEVEKVLSGKVPSSEFEYSIELPDGPHWFTVHIAPLKGLRSGAVLAHQDITDKKVAETARDILQRQLRENAKVRTLGSLTSGIAHEFNNLITVIQGHLRLAIQDSKRNSKVLESLNVCASACESALILGTQILSFGRPRATNRVSGSLITMVRDMQRLLEAPVPANITLSISNTADVPEVVVDVVQLQQVLLNLVLNAVHAIGQRTGSITIEIGSARVPKPDSPRSDPTSSLFAVLTVSDTGKGMPPKVLQHIFEPFFSTKGPGKGSGLGLSIAQQILMAHGGGITVSSTPGVGTKFMLFIPPRSGSEVPSEVTRVKEQGRVNRGQGQVVLYLDDQRWLVPLVERLLNEQGYQVRGFFEPQSALDAIKSGSSEFDIVITDYKMPEISGLDITRAVKSASPDTPVILVSGLLSDMLTEQARSCGADAILFKPTLMDDLVPCVARLLKDKRPTSHPAASDSQGPVSS